MSTAIEDARRTFSAVFSAGWTVAYPTYPIAHENQKFKPNKQVPWVDFNLSPTGRSRMNIGSKRFVRTFGTIIIECYVPEDHGSRTLFEMMDKALEILEEKNFVIDGAHNATTQTGRPTNLGQTEAFYAGMVAISFYVDEAI